MATRALLLLVLLSLAHPAGVRAERLPTRVFTTTDGLASNAVHSIVPDSRGYVWFCTREGLSRFDGHGFTTSGLDDGLPGAVINDLIETKEGVYWIATNRGLVRFDPLGNRPSKDHGRPMFSTFKPDTDPRAHDVWTLFQDRSGAVWIGTQVGLYKLNEPGTGSVTFARIDIGGAEVTCLAEDAAGALWIGTSGGALRLRPDRRFERYAVPEGLPANDVNTIRVDRQGRIWIGMRSGGLAVLTLDRVLQRPTIVGVYSTRNGLPSNWIAEIFEARDGALWAATGNGLVEIVATAGADRYRFRTFGRGLGLVHPATTAVAEDRTGSLWVGSKTGVARIPAARFTVYGEADGIRSVGTLLETRNDGVIAMEVSGYWRFFRFVDQRPVVTELRLSPGTQSWGWNQMALVDSGGDWWIGTRTGVLRYHGVSHLEQLARATPVARYTKRDGLAADVVIRLFEDSRRDVWIATVGEGHRSGLSRWERKSGALHHYAERDGLPPFDRLFVSAFAEDGGGNVWVGFDGDGGLVRYNRQGFERFGSNAGVPPGGIRNLIRDAHGRLWAASSRGGLIRVDRPADDRPAFSRYTTAQGLSSNEVTTVVEDNLGRVYAGTGRALDRLDPATGRIRTYRTGLPVGEMLSAIRDRAGVLWISYGSGLVRIVPADDPPPSAATVPISGIRVAGQAQALSALGQSDLEFFELPWNRNSLEVDFVSPGFGPGDGLRYQIKLDGGDPNWSSPSDQRRVAYANLAPGRYRFQARAVDAEGVASDPAAGFSFQILPPVWQRWWFRGPAALLVLGLAYGFYRSRVSRLLEVAAMRTRIATDLHDDIGANLTRIAVLSEVVRRQGHAGAEDHLASIATVARESVTAMSDIVWAIGPGRDGLNDLTRKMREHSEEVFAAGDTELTFTGPEMTREMWLSVDMRRDIYLIFKEAINNAARHSGCSRVEVAVRSDGSRLILSVVDDGEGFDAGAEDPGNGLASMRRRAQRLGASFDISSRRGQGTAVRLDVPHHRAH